MLARTDRAHSWSLFKEALRADLEDTQGERRVKASTSAPWREPPTWCCVLRRCGNPGRRPSAASVLPGEIGKVSFQIIYRGQPVDVELTQRHAKLRLLPCAADPINLCVEGIEKTLGPGRTWVVELPEN